MNFISVALAEQPKIIDTLVAAYYQDPFLRWLYPNYDTYLEAFPQLCECLLEGSHVCVSTDYAGVAVWVDADTQIDEERVHQLHQKYLAKDTMQNLGVVRQRYAESCKPYASFWSLQMLAVHPDHQHKGLAKELLRYSFQQLDQMTGGEEEPWPTLLYTNLLLTVKLYEDVGFRTIDQFLIDGSLENYVMIRD